MKREQENPFNDVAYRMDSEGIDYCFDGYSEWNNIDDPVFHRLRDAYLNAKVELENYVMEHADDE